MESLRPKESIPSCLQSIQLIRSNQGTNLEWNSAKYWRKHTLPSMAGSPLPMPVFYVVGLGFCGVCCLEVLHWKLELQILNKGTSNQGGDLGKDEIQILQSQKDLYMREKMLLRKETEIVEPLKKKELPCPTVVGRLLPVPSLEDVNIPPMVVLTLPLLLIDASAGVPQITRLPNRSQISSDNRAEDGEDDYYTFK
ncbi:hypothetical protein M9H77_03214 [Catharanthus roseus]|uniref:Uncharacterized protein n=1 Tax=Catharanthus roseus TaxID=4058 RepID=A0ACC0CB31_CATRO|nr:hypothetical protein M9H77_03214 [Catharanthus roseus]